MFCGGLFLKWNDRLNFLESKLVPDYSSVMPFRTPKIYGQNKQWTIGGLVIGGVDKKCKCGTFQPFQLTYSTRTTFIEIYANLVNFVFVWRCPYPRVYVFITLCTPVRERPFPSPLLCVSAQVAPPLSLIESFPLLDLYQYSCYDASYQLNSWEGWGATDLKNPSPYY